MTWIHGFDWRVLTCLSCLWSDGLYLGLIEERFSIASSKWKNAGVKHCILGSESGLIKVWLNCSVLYILLKAASRLFNRGRYNGSHIGLDCLLWLLSVIKTKLCFIITLKKQQRLVISTLFYSQKWMLVLPQPHILFLLYPIIGSTLHWSDSQWCYWTDYHILTSYRPSHRGISIEEMLKWDVKKAAHWIRLLVKYHTVTYYTLLYRLFSFQGNSKKSQGNGHCVFYMWMEAPAEITYSTSHK